MSSFRRRSRKTVIGIIGGFVLAVGLVAIPYPGPGWLIVFAGLGILSTEFEWAQRLLAFATNKYDAWQDWLKKQPAHIKVCFWLLAATVVVLTIWILNGYGLLNQWLRLGFDWLESPLLR